MVGYRTILFATVGIVASLFGLFNPQEAECVRGCLGPHELSTSHAVHMITLITSVFCIIFRLLATGPAGPRE